VPLTGEEGAMIHEPADPRLSPDAAADLKDMRNAEVAKVLGCSAKAVEVRIYRARQALREALANRPPKILKIFLRGSDPCEFSDVKPDSCR